jgi:hypothetical protein
MLSSEELYVSDEDDEPERTDDDDDGDDALVVAPGARRRGGTAPIEDMLRQLGYPREEHQEILRELTAVPQQQRDSRLARCCACACRRAEDDGMVVYVERGVGAGAAIKLVLEDDRSDTIEQVKQQIHEEQGTQEGEMLVLTFDGKRLNDSATVEECGIGPGSTLRLDENGITFKKLSRWHTRSADAADLQRQAQESLAAGNLSDAKAAADKAVALLPERADLVSLQIEIQSAAAQLAQEQSRHLSAEWVRAGGSAGEGLGEPLLPAAAPTPSRPVSPGAPSE